ncbi:MAG: hypothetical protein JW995_03410 [Melioribacteraceae bacterium]|nr:hypothetical protein [Melioribacteraceae bacterium]
MSPLLYNALVAVASVVYVFAVVALMDLLVRKGFPQDISRKIVHIAASSWLIFWVLYDSTHWSFYFNIAPAAIWFVLLIIKGFSADENDEAVKTMTRTGDRKELLKGPLYFTIIMMIMGTVYYNSQISAITMGILGWGDGLAPLFGKKFGRHTYNFVCEKTWEGSLAFLIFGIVGAFVYSVILFGELNMVLITICAVLTTIIEALSPKNADNLLIPAACLILFYLI